MSEREKYIAKTKGGKNTMSTKDATLLKLMKNLKGASSDADKLKAFKKINDFSVPGAKAGGLMEATAKLKAKGMSEGGMMTKDKVVSMDTSPNSGLITTKGFGAGKRT